ncbi:MAG TPA: metallophosphoesterase [Thermoanaerobaculia bacterium]|nr:metallophosphoesterase [Thermoanaerobaculia bacterium]
MIEARSGRFAVVGDLQRTSRAEFWRESNPEERRRLVAEIAARDPDFVVGLGDLVFEGSSRGDWEGFDALTAPLRAAGVPILPILGNHEYWARRGPALRNAFARFPRLAASRWYAETYGPLRLLFLDSNERALGAAAWREEADWMNSELALADEEAAVRGVVVFVHHPPYTNSTVTGDELHVRRAFVPPFAAAKKTIAMISGHVHSYEHFVRGGKAFLVAGGGGGPRARLARGAKRRHVDDLFEGPEVRHFHFLLCAPDASGLDVEVVGLEKGGDTFPPLARFALAWPT